MDKKICVAVFFGGVSGEHEVSLVSGSSIIQELKKNDKYSVIEIGIGKSGKWFLGDHVLETLKTGKEPETDESVFFSLDPAEKGLVVIKNSGNKKEVIKVDVIFPVLHGTNGEDGTIQGLFKLSNIPYVGCNVPSSALAMDKILSKRIFASNGLPVVPDIFFTRKDWKENQEDIIKRCEELGYNLFIKPANTGSSVGITKAHNREELKEGIELAEKYDFIVQVEKSIDNAREIEVAILGNDRPKASIAGEIAPSGEFYDYAAKYEDGKSLTIVPARITDEQMKDIQEKAVKAFVSLGCRGLSRVDFLMDPKTEEIYLNEINTLPGFTSISMYPKLWEASGIEYGKLLENVIDLAFEEFDEKHKNSTSFKTKNDWYKKG